jgi:CTP:molybdopterin cytidylyltransferase MocA
VIDATDGGAGRLVGLVLGAGRGERAGGPKALVRDARGVPLAVLHVRALEAAGAADVIVVLREEVARALGPELPWSARVVVSREPDGDGPAGSIRAAMSAVDALAPAAVVVSPVDKRAAPASLIEALLAAIRGGAAAARPVHGGRGGHPVVLRRGVLAPYAAHDVSADRPAPPPLRDVLHGLGRGPGGVADVPWSDEVLDDLDDAEALARVLGGA